MAPPQHGQQPWHHGLYSCFTNCGICLYGYCCSPCLYGQNVSDTDGSSCVLNCLIYYLLASIGCCCIVHAQTRRRLRDKYNLAEEPCGDCCVATFCCACGICQEANEIRYRSKQPQVGYQGTQMTPPPPQQFAPGPAYPPPPSGAPRY